MTLREPLTEWATAALREQGVDADQIRYTVSTDLSRDGAFREGWIVVAGDRLHHLGGEDGPGGATGGLDLTTVDSLEVESLVSGGLLVARRGADRTLVARFTSSRTRPVGKLARVLNKIHKNETLEPSDLEEESEAPTCPTCGLRYPDPVRKICPKCLDRRSLFARVLSYLPRYRGAVALVMVLMVASAALRLVSPYLGGRIFFDDVLTPGGRYHGRLLAVLAVMAVFQLAIMLVDMVHGRVTARVAAWVAYDIKTGIFASLQRLSLSFYNRKQTGGLMTRVNHDAIHLQYFLLDGIPWLVVNTLIAVGIVVVMALMDWRLTLLVVLPAPIIVVVARRVFPRMWILFGRLFRRESALNNRMNDTFTGMRVVKSFGMEHQEIRRFHPANDELYDAALETGRMWALVFPIFQFIMQIGGLAVWAVGGYEVTAGLISFGTLMTFANYIVMLYNPLQFFANVIEWWTHCMNAAQRIFEIMDTPPEIADRPDPVRLPRITGSVALQAVTFAYEPNRPVLRAIDLTIPAGRMVGLVGPTGAGKSTLTNLVARLYEAQEGSIRIDGVPIQDIALEDLRRDIGIVLQETYLFSGTVAENLAYASPGADRARIVSAAKAANAHDFIVALPDGYDTLLGRKGADLSGGERQRIAIARALLKDPRILIFDEATSSVDTETESRIQAAIETLVAGRTTIAIAHRLSTLRRADFLVVMEKGAIAEQGTHEELMLKRGTYYGLVHRERQALKILGVGGDT